MKCRFFFSLIFVGIFLHAEGQTGSAPALANFNDYNARNISALNISSLAGISYNEDGAIDDARVVVRNKIKSVAAKVNKERSTLQSIGGDFTITYNDEAKIINSDSDPGIKIENTYDSLGLIAGKKESCGKSTWFYKASYQYNKEERELIQTWKEIPNNEITQTKASSSYFWFDGYGRLIASKVYEIETGFNYDGEYLYDPFNRPAKVNRTYFSIANDSVNPNSPPQDLATYYYGGYGLDSIVTSHINFTASGTGLLDVRTKTCYNREGLRTSTLAYDGNDVVETDYLYAFRK